MAWLEGPRQKVMTGYTGRVQWDLGHMPLLGFVGKVPWGS